MWEGVRSGAQGVSCTSGDARGAPACRGRRGVRSVESGSFGASCRRAQEDATLMVGRLGVCRAGP